MQASVSSSEESEESVDEDGDEDDDDKDDDDLHGSSRIDPVQALNSSLRSQAQAQADVVPDSHKLDDDAEESEDEDTEIQDIQSNRSPSRSPIMFNSQSAPGKPELSKPTESASYMSDESNDDDSVYEDESTDGEVEVSEEGDDEDEDEDRAITTGILRSSPPALNPMVSIAPGKYGQRKNIFTTSPSSPTDESFNTQDEVDFQLTSSLYEASSATVKSTPIPIPSSGKVATPKFTVGASLSSLNAKKPFLGSSASKANGKSQPLKLANNDEDSDEEESEESDSDSSSDSDNDNEPETSQTLPKRKYSRSAESDSDTTTSGSDSDSESGSNKENEDEKEQARNELAAQIAKVVNDSQASTQSYDPPSPKLVRASQSSSKGSGKRASGGREKFLTGYVFSQPK